ncbi:hypothetical protein [Hymenobacter negativus]|uniref:DUF4369 domain-containing protein n=1 Tax=Hymenobacter negativus TaxID=2795026 RepID=A0ABS3QA72_9BACT|nr:hypothetical protein [Hymenobacter negativus]MBO2008141.1 hypothetical protein [Hymenobacter negativus]
MTFPLSHHLPAVALLGVLLTGCSPTPDKPAATTATRPAKAAEKPFVGTIRLVEHRYVLGIRSTDYVTLTFDGPRLRREVRPGGFADSTERYGLIADLRTDSVTYYVQDAQLNAHCRLARASYLASVAANAPLFTALDRKPYSTIFEPLPPGSPALRSAAVAGPALRRLSSYQAVLFLLPDHGRCDVFYSEQVRVPKAALAYIEHHAPAALPSLALAVHYTPPPQSNAAGLLDRLHQRLNNAFSEDTDFDSFDPNASADSFDLPSGSTNNLEETMSAETHSSHHHHHH